MPSLLRRLGAGVALASALAIAAAAAHAAGPTLTAYDPTFHAMSGTAGADGQGPQGDLAVDANDALYGANLALGLSPSQRCNCTLGGTILRISPSGVTTALHRFLGPDGLGPSTGLLLAQDGFLYGMTAGGGSFGAGTVFRVARDGSGFTTLHHFGGAPADGAWPWHGTLVQAPDGAFYGTTMKGGARNRGAVFKMTADGTVTLLHSFAGGLRDGATPRGGLLLASDGRLYGTTLCGGAHETAGSCSGTVYRISTTGAFQVIHSFDANPASATGALPQSGLVEVGGLLYGTTTGGGTAGFGTVYRLAKDGSGFATLHDFGGGVMGAPGNLDGAAPVGRLLLASDGWLYGTTSQGGPNAVVYPKGDGTIFRVSTTGTYQLLHAFGGVPGDGAHPVTGLAQNGRGMLFGTLETGSVNGTGSVFSFPLPTAP